MSKTKNSKRLDKLQEDFLNLEHCICCDVEILQEVEYDSPTNRDEDNGMEQTLVGRRAGTKLRLIG